MMLLRSLTFWFGDLNYRITDVPIEKVKLLIRDKNYDALIQRDQVVVFPWLRYAVWYAVVNE